MTIEAHKVGTTAWYQNQSTVLMNWPVGKQGGLLQKNPDFRLSISNDMIRIISKYDLHKKLFFFPLPSKLPLAQLARNCSLGGQVHSSS